VLGLVRVDVYVAAFSLDGLMEHDTELDTTVCYTDTHGYTEVVMETAALLGYELVPRIKDIKDQSLYKMDRQQHYANLDPILSETIKPHVIRNALGQANLHDVHEVKGFATSRSSATRSSSTRTRTCASGFFRFVLAGMVTRYIILGCM
jgi:TnpA family transposase